MSIRLMTAVVAVIALTFAATPALAAIQPANMVFYYTFDEANEVVQDDSGNGVVGALHRSEPVNPVYPSYTAEGEGRIGAPAMDFGGAGNSAWVEVSSDTAFTSIMANDSFTVSFFQMWGEGQPNSNVTFRAHDVADLSGGARLIGAHTPWSNGIAYLDTGGCCGGGNRISMAWDGGVVGEWNHFSFTKDGENTAIYIDGVEFVTGDGKLPLDNLGLVMNQFSIGADGEGGNSFNGLIDDFAVWDVALSAEDIMRVSQHGAGVPEPSTVALIACAAFGLTAIRKRRAAC